MQWGGILPAFGVPLLLAGWSAPSTLLGTGQTPSPASSPPSVKVDVASVKQNLSNDPGPQFSPYGDGASIRAITVQLMLEIVYSVQSFQILGGPGWLRSDRFDIVAKLKDAAGNPAGRRLPDILRGVLAERFHLKAHRETREGSTYDSWSRQEVPSSYQPPAFARTWPARALVICRGLWNSRR
jgi:hypothetical protein